MPVPRLDKDDNLFWHEKDLMVLMLNRGPMQKKELLDELAREQKKRIIFGQKDWTHSNSAYRYWLESRKRQRVISDHGSILELTPLGKWLANSTLRTFFERDDLLSLICGHCVASGHLVFCTPLMDTAETNAKGRLFMDLQCPRCSHYLNRTGLSEVLSKEEFSRFYNQALKELSGVVTGEPLMDR